MVRLVFARMACALSAAALFQACDGARDGARADLDQPARVDGARLRAADGEPGNWMAPGRTFGEQRFSPLDQINDGNVDRLGLAWYADLDINRGVEATPLVIDGVLYNITPWNVTTAYDAVTGDVLWRFDPEVPREFGRLACCDIVTRGVAAWNGKIYLATLDGRLIAVDARNGEEVWSVQTLDGVWPYTITGAPRVYDGKVVIGNAGAEGAARGYVGAYDAETGEKAWRFNVVPGNPADGFVSDAEAMAAETWNGEWWKTGGGGTVWDSMAYDPDLRLVYLGTGNGGPWAQAHRSPGGGDNLFISSIVALDIDTGDYVWHYQETPGDEWDFTATQSIILADIEIDGQLRNVILHAPKNGFFYVIDRATGKVISAEPYVPVSWASRIDLETGRPVETPQARYGEEPVLLSPGAAGGHNWNPMAYSPETGYAYFPVLKSYMVYSLDADFEQEPGEMHQLGIANTGFEEKRREYAAYISENTENWLMAWDPVAQEEVWRAPYPRRGSGGVLATAGNLVFEGSIETTFGAFRADTGEKVWEMPVDQIPIAAPMSYMVDGVQYIAVNAGWGGGLAHGPSAKAFEDIRVSETARLLVFKLDGNVSLPVRADAEVDPADYVPPPDTAGEAEIDRGRLLFADTCSGCHGVEARGGIKDLRRMAPEIHEAFYDIVLDGSLLERGMAGFSDKLSEADAQAVHAYLIRRAHEAD